MTTENVGGIALSRKRLPTTHSKERHGQVAIPGRQVERVPASREEGGVWELGTGRGEGGGVVQQEGEKKKKEQKGGGRRKYVRRGDSEGEGRKKGKNECERVIGERQSEKQASGLDVLRPSVSARLAGTEEIKKKIEKIMIIWNNQNEGLRIAIHLGKGDERIREREGRVK
ncbi:uncharacterized protein BO66DRAFT_248411 [Aspergillus aculeatinus CBS 121060]|uniref:Uncharacterized protein n=1 Tax=Aspergillus aculeatinus CBS 121060 TaxID=1448322 RepID=A0ACD1GS17_9EURO|nr:hypothetical protein BO66DRAFT_248411 [Aspergillus aculeatinus CBS 121060]RAH64112.1 hypothetical protein BO66DRAFT_248411 [Aspergillus aculeatinus CBS 121060]